MKPLAERLTSRIGPRNERGCIPWLGGLDAYGYGRVRTDPKKGTVKTHRLAYMLANGPIPAGLCVLHSCDNPACVNPEHLVLGTRTDNARHRVERRRQAVGHSLPHTKLTENQVREVRARYSGGGTTQIALAAAFNVKRTTIAAILAGRSWKHVA